MDYLITNLKHMFKLIILITLISIFISFSLISYIINIFYNVPYFQSMLVLTYILMWSIICVIVKYVIKKK